MSNARTSLRIGFIPLVDAAALLIAVDKGFAEAEGLDITLVREVSWSNVRDKLNIGLFDAAHLLAPVAIASSLGLAQVREPIAVPFTLALNGNAITLSPALHDELRAQLDGDIANPAATGHALARVIAARRATGGDPLTFGMTFPFSLHNYQLRFWMGAAGIDPDEDVRLVVLPPPYMVDSLVRGQVDGFCVGAPWNSVAVSMGIGRILHFGADIIPRITEKVLALRQCFADQHTDTVGALVRALHRGALFAAAPQNHAEVAALLARPDRVGVDPHLIQRTLEGCLRLDSDGTERRSGDYLLIGRDSVGRPDPVHAEWLYLQMARWRQTPYDPAAQATAHAVFRPDLYNAALASEASPPAGSVSGGTVGAFAGPVFTSGHAIAFLDYWNARRPNAAD
jgi:NitT/TauT family transport system ATP-binding protein